MKGPIRSALRAALLAFAGLAGGAVAAPDASILVQAQAQKAPFLDTLKGLVSIESGSHDREGLDRIADLVAARLRALGGNVDVINPLEEVARPDGSRVRPGKAVRATFKGKGAKKILLLAHMDTVYQRGMLAGQPFRIDGDKVYGLAVADDKQGIALILHAIAALQALRFDEFDAITVVINGDEEIGSPGSRELITAMGAEHDATMSFEASGATNDRLSLTTAGIGTAVLRVRGRASHAGSAPHLGVNALYEMAHQVLQMRDLSDPVTGSKLNWTLAKAGTVLNAIPSEAQATADVRVLKVADYAALEAKARERIKIQLIPEAKVEMEFVHGRPPLELTPASLALARHSQGIYREVGKELKVEETAVGGGTDAAYAGLKARGPVVERYGVQGFGVHSGSSEYILLDNIEPRLYLVTRTIMDIARQRVH